MSDFLNPYDYDIVCVLKYFNNNSYSVIAYSCINQKNIINVRYSPSLTILEKASQEDIDLFLKHFKNQLPEKYNKYFHKIHELW